MAGTPPAAAKGVHRSGPIVRNISWSIDAAKPALAGGPLHRATPKMTSRPSTASKARWKAAEVATSCAVYGSSPSGQLVAASDASTFIQSMPAMRAPCVPIKLCIGATGVYALVRHSVPSSRRTNTPRQRWSGASFCITTGIN